MVKIWVTEDDPQVETLRESLNHFYEHLSHDYTAFEGTSKHTKFWNVIINRARGMRRPALKILEFGAGRTGFVDHARKADLIFYFAAQDVTRRNEDYLASVCDEVHIGDLASMEGQFDVIFSTYVWEHVANPRTTFEQLDRLLAPGGSLFLQSPRYDLPGYVPPVLRHMARHQQWFAAARLFAKRIAGAVGFKSARFLVVIRPAVLECQNWFIDADAVHLVSRQDLVVHCRRNSFVLRDIYEDYSDPIPLRDRFTKLMVEIKRSS